MIRRSRSGSLVETAPTDSRNRPTAPLKIPPLPVTRQVIHQFVQIVGHQQGFEAGEVVDHKDLRAFGMFSVPCRFTFALERLARDLNTRLVVLKANGFISYGIDRIGGCL